MSRGLRLIWLLLGLGAFVFLGALFVLPSRWEVVRTREVAAPPERVFAQLDDLRAWRAWSPWREDAYPGLVFKYTGPPRGAGAPGTWSVVTSAGAGAGSIKLVPGAPAAPVTIYATRAVDKNGNRSLTSNVVYTGVAEGADFTAGATALGAETCTFTGALGAAAALAGAAGAGLTALGWGLAAALGATALA